MVGRAVAQELRKYPSKAVIATGKKDLDLMDIQAVRKFLKTARPSSIIFAAAQVGGIGANLKSPFDFISNNLQIQSNVMQAAYESGIRRLVFLASSCIYPTSAEIPFVETEDFGRDLDPSVRPFALAKIAGMEMVTAMRTQHGMNWVSVIPSNTFGPGDNYSLTHGHVIASLVRRFSEAQTHKYPEITIWGSGKAMREFTHVADLARAIVLVEQVYDSKLPINISSGEEATIKQLAELLKVISGYEGQIKFDSQQPEGVKRKVLDNSRLLGLGWSPKVPLTAGISSTFEDFRSTLLSNPNSVRL